MIDGPETTEQDQAVSMLGRPQIDLQAVVASTGWGSNGPESPQPTGPMVVGEGFEGCCEWTRGWCDSMHSGGTPPNGSPPNAGQNSTCDRGGNGSARTPWDSSLETAHLPAKPRDRYEQPAEPAEWRWR